jgi:hypothetical protein
MITSFTFSSLLAILFAIIMISSPLRFVTTIAHNFSPNESASFISLVDQIRSVLTVLNQYDLSNKTEIVKQAQYARMLLTDSVLKELDERNKRIATDLPQGLDSLQNLTNNEIKSNISRIDDLLSEAISVRIDPGQLENKTVQALALATDVDMILNNYNAALNSSNALMTENMSTNMNMSEGSMLPSTNITDKKAVKIIDAFQRAVALTNIAIDRFNTQLKGASNDTFAMDEVAKGLEQLGKSIENKESISKIMGIVHGQIHPNLQTAFDLELAQNIKLPPTNMTDSMQSSMQGHMMNMS